MEEPSERIVNKQQLLAIGDRFEAEIAADREQDAPYR
jgi:NADH-quinone oxidoreductase subunit I